MKAFDWEMDMNDRVSTLITRKDIGSQTFRRDLTNLIVNSLHTPVLRMTDGHKSLLILERLLDEIAQRNGRFFTLRFFLESFPVKGKEREALVRALLYGLYYGDINLADYLGPGSGDDVKFLILQVLAENTSLQYIKEIFSKLTTHEFISLICFVYRHKREGTSHVLRAIDEGLLSPDLYKLLDGLRMQCIDENRLSKLLQEKTDLSGADFHSILDTLDNVASEEAYQAFELFNKVIPLMIDSPVRVYEAMEELKQQAAPLVYQPNLAEKQQAYSQFEGLKERFRSYLEKPFTPTEFFAFVSIFGLKGHLPDLVLRGELKRNTTLVEKMQILHEVFSDPLLIVGTHPEQARESFVLVMIMMLHMETMRSNPGKYLSGLQKMAVAIPTIGKEISAQPALYSVIRGMQGIQIWLKQRLGTDISLKNFPIVVYDQSEPDLFKTNAACIRKWENDFQCKILHMSQENTLQLARKLEIEPLINTSGTGAFGYGGSRNCCFLLTPVLRRAYQAGKGTVREIIAMDKKALKELFQIYTLGGITPDNHGDAILMIDDDMNIPEANFFSHTWFTDEHWQMYAASYGYSYGRSTKVVVFPDLNQLLNTPWKTSIFSLWQKDAGMSGMSEFLSKPRFCLNLPFGSEEGHLSGSFEYIPLLKPAAHDGGTRFPKSSLPTYPWVGLEERIASFGPYAFHIWMVVNLLDPLDRKRRGVFPWNEENLPRKVSCLRELFSYIADPQNTQEMQRRFWRNVDHLFKMPNPKWLKHLTGVDVEKLIKTYSKQHPLNKDEKRSLERIEKLFSSSQTDIETMQAFSKQVVKGILSALKPYKKASGKRWHQHCIDLPIDLHHIIEDARGIVEKHRKIKLTTYPFTQALYLLFRVVGAAEFNAHITHLLENKT